MKKFLLTFVLILACAFCASAEGLKIGIITKSVTEDEITEIIKNDNWYWTLLHNGHGSDDKYKYYGSLNSALIALNAGEIDEFDLPEDVAVYVVKHNPEYVISCAFKRAKKIGFYFGVLESNKAMLESLNKIISEMSDDGTLKKLEDEYLKPETRDAKLKQAVEFDQFDGAETIKIAVTGDMPPVDYIDESGKPSGFNTAILAEIGRRLKINISLVNIESGAKAAALASGRADVAFWFTDRPNEEIILSKPYHKFDTFLQIRKK